MIKFLKNKIKNFNKINGNFLNYAPVLIKNNQINLIKNRRLKKLIQLNLFYNNKNFNEYFWKEIISYLNTKKLNEKNFFKNIKKNYSSKNYLEIISIYQIMLLIGRFKLAFKLRNFFFKIFFSKKIYFKNSYIQKLNRINSLLQNTELKKLSKKKIKDYLILKKKNQINLDYSNYIKDKKINLLGVGIAENVNMKNFLNADVVVKLNYHNKKQSKNFQKCEVSYYSDNFLKKKRIIKKNLNLQFMLIKKNWKNKKYKNYKVRQFQVFDDMIIGTPTLLVNCVLDLLLRKPRSIKIFNSTIYYPIESKIYDINQKKGYGITKKTNIIRGFGVHDIISEFLILRNLFYLRLIQVDNNLKYVLNLKIDKFLFDMEKFYKPVVFDFYK